MIKIQYLAVWRKDRTQNNQEDAKLIDWRKRIKELIRQQNE